MGNSVWKAVKSDYVLRTFVHVVFGIPFCWLRRGVGIRHSRLPYMVLPVACALLHWWAYGFEMYVSKTYMRAKKAKPREPTDTVIIMVLLNLSGACTFTLAVAFFFNPSNKFHSPLTSLIPNVEFKPDGQQETIAPSRMDWMCTNLFLCFGTLIVGSMYYADLNNSFFNYYGIKNFTWDGRIPISNSTLTTYKVGVGVLFWALEGSVVFCCVFYAMTRDIVRHIKFTERLMLESIWDLRTAKLRLECLFEYADKMAGSLNLWFIIHSLLFASMVLALVVDWMQITTSPRQDHLKEILMAQTTGSLLIAYKFSFPFLAASKVTSQFDKMFNRFNYHFNSVDHQHSEAFLTYFKRCKPGFKILGIRITLTVALLSFASSFVGFLKLYRQLDVTPPTPNVMIH